MFECHLTHYIGVIHLWPSHAIAPSKCASQKNIFVNFNSDW